MSVLFDGENAVGNNVVLQLMMLVVLLEEFADGFSGDFGQMLFGSLFSCVELNEGLVESQLAGDSVLSL